MEMKISNLNENPEYFEQVISSIETAFEYSQGQSYEVDFYPLMSKRNWRNCYILLKNSEFVAHIGTLPEDLGHEKLSLPVTLIGGIVVAPKFQRKGHFTHFFEDILRIVDSKTALSFLWSDKHKLYQNFGYHLSVGCQSYPSKVELHPRNNLVQTKFSRLTRQQQNQVRSCYDTANKNTLSIKRSLEDWSVFNQMNSVDLYTHENHDGLISYYFCKNKGKDLTRIVHEYGYIDQASKKDLFEAIRSEKIWTHEGEDCGRKFQLEYSCLTRLKINREFKDWFSKMTRNQIELENQTGEKITFEYQDKKHTLKTQDFLTGLFGPNRLEEFKQFFPPLNITGLSSV
jgi:predicted acetyltransferase